jgi:hypothetical protein
MTMTPPPWAPLDPMTVDQQPGSVYPAGSLSTRLLSAATT